MPRKGKMSTIRYRNSKKKRKLSTKERKQKRERMERYAATEREKERPARILRNGVEIVRKDPTP